MKTIKVDLGERTYPVFIGQGVFLKTARILKDLKLGQEALIITNPALQKKIGLDLSRAFNKENIAYKFFTVIGSEKAKSISSCLELINKISIHDKGKQVFFIALGGGVVGDLTGFIASIYKRGTAYAQIPTTLLSQIDSAIGGKTAIDLKVAKNLVGTFFQPKAVFADSSLLESLPARQLVSGLAEVIKYAVIKDKELFDFLEKNREQILSLKKEAIDFIEYRCIKIKAEITSKDEYDKKDLRIILNFGHTIGHALESACDYSGYTHGEAISIGMACASEIAVRLRMLLKEDKDRIVSLLKAYGLPVRINKNLSINRIMASLKRDKKFVHVKNRFVLPVEIGKAAVKDNISEELIEEVILFSR